MHDSYSRAMGELNLHYFLWPGGMLMEHGEPDCFSDQSTSFAAEHLYITPGGVVAEPGCGTGMLAVLAAKLGASSVYATDVNPAMVEFATRNVLANDVPQVKVLEGNLLEPIPSNVPIDTVIALLPHRPSSIRINTRFYGGWDGCDLIMKLLDQCETRLTKGARLYLYHNALANPFRVKKRLEELFKIKRSWERKRDFTWDEFEKQCPGLMLHLLELRRTGQTDFKEEGEEGYSFVATLYLGIRK